MISYKEALKKLSRSKLSIKSETILSENSLNRICSENVYSKFSYPAADNTAFDGYAINSNESNKASKSNIIKLKILKIIEDCIKGYLGPLAGVLSAMKYANSLENKFKWIITFPCDTPFFEKLIIEQMIEKADSPKEKIYFIKDKKQRHNIFGLWSTSLETILEEDLKNNFRKVDFWADKIGCNFIEKDIQNENEFLNINTKEDLELAEKIYKKNDFI